MISYCLHCCGAARAFTEFSTTSKFRVLFKKTVFNVSITVDIQRSLLTWLLYVLSYSFSSASLPVVLKGGCCTLSCNFDVIEVGSEHSVYPLRRLDWKAPECFHGSSHVSFITAHLSWCSSVTLFTASCNPQNEQQYSFILFHFLIFNLIVL